MNRPILSIALILFAFQAFAQDSISKYYKIYDTRTRQQITTSNIVEDMNRADVLFFGEEHNDSAGHYLENKLFRELHARYGSQVALSLEMFETDNQQPLNDYLAGFIDEARLAKDARLWSNYKDYRPMVDYAKQNKLSVVAANAPRRYVSLVGKRGMAVLDSLDNGAKQLLPALPYDTLAGRYREKFYEVMKGSPGGDNPKVYYSQSLWDAGMSYSIYRYLKKNKGQKVFHCVGKFHVEERLGTAAQLQNMNRKLKILVISMVSDDNFNNPDWNKLGILGDYVILTDPTLKKTF
jgi:uncharacterized iron-regulated protein